MRDRKDPLHRHRRSSVLLALLLSCVLGSEPAPAQESQTFEATAAFIQDTVREKGRYSPGKEAPDPNNPDRPTRELRQAYNEVDLSRDGITVREHIGCTIFYANKDRDTAEGEKQYSARYAALATRVTVFKIDELSTPCGAHSGQPMFVVHTGCASGKCVRETHVVKEVWQRGSKRVVPDDRRFTKEIGFIWFYVTDEQIAQRLAKALSHLIKLGGGVAKQ